MKLKNNIKFDNHVQAWDCGKVLFRIPSRYNQEIMNAIRFLHDKIFEAASIQERDDGTVRIRLTKDWTEYYGQYIKDSVHSVEQMYKQKYADAFMKLFSYSEED
jgi:uncharacterized phage-associated protein